MRILVSGDYNVFNDGWNGCGVYMASGAYVSSTFNPPIYIGSSYDLKDRIYTHTELLRRGQHVNNPFQHSWDRHPEEFIWFLLESCEENNLLSVEQLFLDEFRPFCDEFKGFNIAHYSSSPMKGRKHTEATIEQIKNTLKETHKNYYPNQLMKRESIDKRAATLRGRPQTEAHKKARGNALAKNWEFLNPNGEVIKIRNLTQFSKENNLSESCMRQVSNGQRKSHKGWTAVKNA